MLNYFDNHNFEQELSCGIKTVPGVEENSGRSCSLKNSTTFSLESYTPSIVWVPGGTPSGTPRYSLLLHFA